MIKTLRESNWSPRDAAFWDVLVRQPAVQHRNVGFCSVSYGVILVLTGLNRWFVMMPPLLVLAGASMTASNTAANSLLQAAASPRLLGQTVTLYMLAMRGGLSLGALLTGVSASLLGVRHALVLNGILAVAAQLGVARLWSRAPLPRAAPDATG